MARRRMELLAPAGGPEQANAALAAGADAFYCGFGHHFNARRGATNFDDESFSAICRRAHLAGARVYVTVNVVIADDELPRALALIRHVWLLGADAFIIQDWGLLALVRRLWPQVEVHISTQANVHDPRGVAWCRDRWGVDRVTISRELSLPEIAAIAQEGVDLEGFAHGALCFCYSGICLMSSLGGGRSANRGLCAQPCRLPYDLVDEEGRRLSSPDVRPLCPKDYRTVERLGELEEAGIGALKIEGRLKAPDYVHAVVRAYRAALDELAGDDAALSVDERERLLRRAFNRDFTSSYLDGRSDNEMMSFERSNNRGELVGRVVATRDLGSSRVWRGGSNGGRERTRKVTLAEVDVALDAPVGRGDLLEVRPVDDPSQFLTTHADRDARAGEVLTCRTARPMAAGCPVRVIRSQQALDDAARAARSEVPRQRAVVARVRCRLGEPLAVELETVDGAARAEAFGAPVEAARSRAVTRDDLVAHVARMGGTAFMPSSVEVELDEGCGLRFSELHAVRGEACRLLAAELLAPYEVREAAKAPSAAWLSRELRRRVAEMAGGADGSEAGGQPGAAVELCALVTSPEAARAARKAGATRLYATADDLARQAWEGERPLAWLDEVCRLVDHGRLDRWVEEGRPVAVGSVSELSLAAQIGALPEVRPCIPVHNTSALAELVDAGATGIWLSPELTAEEVVMLAEQSPVPVGLVAYGRTRAMTSEHCVLQVAGRCVHDCARCALRQQKLSLEGGKGELYPVRTDLQGRSRIYAAEPLDAAPEVGELLLGGVRRLLVDGTLLSPRDVAAAVARLAEAVRRTQAEEVPLARLAGHGSGHLHRAID